MRIKNNFGEEKLSFCVVACARNENLYINEWIIYHLHIGYDHIFLYCNDDDPALLFSAVLPFIQSGKLTFHHHPTKGDQWGMYNHFNHVYRNDYKWVTYLDVDEFITIKDNKNIKQFMAEYDRYDCLYLNWVLFGTNNHETNPEGLVLQNYTKRDQKPNTTFKIILKTSSIDVPFMDQHRCPFWHGVGYGDWAYNPFNHNELNSVNVNHIKIKDVLQENDKYTDENSETIMKRGYVSHFYLKSSQAYHERIRRGKELGPGWSLDWEEKLIKNEHLIEIDRTNSTEDNYLKNISSNLFWFCF
ncbi:glycosyltransferase family 2 protein [Acetobacter tropicalis]|uniref:glycosyltransferase family 2 protein n=1 Tax=Acetobacter tropicalis TaxID=104102 RepID=UPI0009DCC702|nr:glycosyltransferase family 2 protein [Acetobacter tropicalis]KAA8389451.1 glycosyltransferase family 2 protein [Acetobacter tropicalis]KAA8390893.1 glycosyltransferase family 2 protein [Acetobacter tropicalis]MBC9008643.1 glycosyltransferase family 2 protein [Acetobacter tropicalis]MDO8170338.1 glycosyltransferase family 2 protein [Acetobacter tropicalis]